MLSISSNRLRYYYETILRQDLLVKLNYDNIMQVPRICEIFLSSRVNSHSVKSSCVALEILSGQKFAKHDLVPDGKYKKFTRLSPSVKRVESITRNKKKHSNLSKERNAFKKTSIGPNTDFTLVEASLRTPDLTYSFLEKLLTVMAFVEHNVEYEVNTIQIRVTGLHPVQLFPEIENHFAYFENVSDFQVKIITSSLREEETKLLWTGLNQKEM